MTKDEYLVLNALPLELKIKKTQSHIREWYNHFGGNVFVGFSGGKDSTVLLHIVREMFPNVVGVFHNTGLENPDIYKFVKTFDNIDITKPKMKFKDIIDKYGWVFPSKEVSEVVSYAQKGSKWALMRLDGFNVHGNPITFAEQYKRYKYLLDAPFKISPKCCKILKKDPSAQYAKETGKQPILGTLACESALRLQIYIRTGCNGYDLTHPSSKPLSFWNEQDILQYILDNKIKIASCYGDIIKDEKGNLVTTGLKRSGCMFCIAGVNREKRPNRFERMKQNYPQHYKYCMETLGLDEILNWLNVPH